MNPTPRIRCVKAMSTVTHLAFVGSLCGVDLFDVSVQMVRSGEEHTHHSDSHTAGRVGLKEFDIKYNASKSKIMITRSRDDKKL